MTTEPNRPPDSKTGRHLNTAKSPMADSKPEEGDNSHRMNNHISSSNNSSSDTHSVAGFPALAIRRIKGAQKLNRITIYLVMLALAIFIIFGTIASLKKFNDNTSVYLLFHYFPYIFVAFAIPLLLYQAFIVSRYRLCQPSMLVMSVGGGMLLLAICLIFSLSNWLWLAMASWIGVAYWFQATFKRFFKFIDIQKEAQNH